MPLTRPTIADLVNTGEAEINALMEGADARMRRSNLGVFARVWALLTHGLYGSLAYLSRQVFAQTAEAEYLTYLADTYGITRTPARAAAGMVRLYGVGASIPFGTVLQSSQGVQYQTTAGVVVPATGYVDAPVVALSTGLESNAVGLVKLSTTAPIYLLTSAEVAPGGLTGGAAEESDDALRARLLFRRRNPPGPGTIADWERWAREFSAEVNRVWVIPIANGNGTVGVVFDTLSGIPSAGLVTQMRAHLDQYLPAGCQLNVYAPTQVPVAFTIAVVPAADPSVRAAIEAELDDLLYREAGPGKTIPLSRVNEAISIAAGELDHTLVAPVAALTFTSTSPTFEVGVRGAITWQ